MAWVRKVGDRGRYWVRDRNCIGCKCFAPGSFQHRGSTMSGSRNTGDVSLMCMTNSYHGCPPAESPNASPDKETMKSHKAEGWRNA